MKTQTRTAIEVIRGMAYTRAELLALGGTYANFARVQGRREELVHELELEVGQKVEAAT